LQHDRSKKPPNQNFKVNLQDEPYLPPAYRHDAKIVKPNHFTLEENDE
jgi:hypothetical protein